MRTYAIIAMLTLSLLLVSCCGQGVVKHDGTWLSPHEQKELYESRQEQTPDPDLHEKRTVYWSASGSKYHLDPECTYLKRASGVQSGTVAQAANHGAASPCSRCAGG